MGPGTWGTQLIWQMEKYFWKKGKGLRVMHFQMQKILRNRFAFAIVVLLVFINQLYNKHQSKQTQQKEPEPNQHTWRIDFEDLDFDKFKDKNISIHFEVFKPTLGTQTLWRSHLKRK